MLFVGGFYALCVVCAGLYFSTRSKGGAVTEAAFRAFQRTYLGVYLLAVAGDWLQGPHVYALYESYGMSKHQIEILFIAGFGSSMLFGTFVGSVADKFGRKKNCLIYGALYAGACLTKHFADFRILMVGRLLGGVATSILYSAFESWLIYENGRRGLGEEALSSMFSQQFLGNSLVAIVTGVVAQYAADMFGFVAPFDLALGCLCLMALLIWSTWTENYGDQAAPVNKSFVDAWATLRSDRKIFCLGMVQSLFEGAMYTFVLEWTPALTAAAKASGGEEREDQRGPIPYGYIFATFMVAIMIGASAFKLMEKVARPESFLRVVLLVAAACLYTPVLMGDSAIAVFSAFIVFEVCVGVFWPTMGVMRGTYVPEATRATTMNFFRVPLNIIVVGVLILDLPMTTIFQACAGFLATAALLQHWLYKQAALLHFRGANSGVGGAAEAAEEKKVAFADPPIHEKSLPLPTLDDAPKEETYKQVPV